MSDPRRTVEAVWRIECARVVGGVARLVGDVGQAEEFAQDALVAALEQWPKTGVPDNPGAWLVTTAKRRAIDHIRRQQNYQRKLTEIGRTLEEAEEPTEIDDVDTIEDDILRLMFVSCHPKLTMDSRVALTLKVVGGLRTDEIGRAFLTPEATIAQRIVRAKRTLAEAGIPFEVPGRHERADRLASVLEAIYLIFNEGYAATTGGDWMRPELCDEATRLGRILAGLMPNEPEVHGLVALMEIQASRAGARIDPDGEPIRLLDQDRSRWNQLLIGRGLAALARGEALVGGGMVARGRGPAEGEAVTDGGALAGGEAVPDGGSLAGGEAVPHGGVLAGGEAVASGGSQPERGPLAMAGAPAERAKRGPYLIQAALAACHARARTAEETDWVRIAIHYRELIEIDPSPIVELNRAVAVAMAFGPQAGLDIVDTLADNPQLKDYHLLPSVRGDLLARLGRTDEAAAEFRRAATMTRNDRERALLEARAKDPSG